jgi:hypothetical protein
VDSQLSTQALHVLRHSDSVINKDEQDSGGLGILLRLCTFHGNFNVMIVAQDGYEPQAALAVEGLLLG